jgi:hypothetical protein
MLLIFEGLLLGKREGTALAVPIADLRHLRHD